MIRHRRFGLRTRLLALVLAPALLLAILGGAAALRQRQAADDLAEIRDEVGVLADLTDLRSALLEARAPVEIGVRAVALGIDRTTALKLLDLQQFSSADLASVERILHRLPEDARPFRTDRLDSLGDAAASTDGVGAIDQFDRLDSLTRKTWQIRFDALRLRVFDTGSTALDVRLDDLQDATQASSAAGTMVTKLADYWFSFLGDAARGGPARSDLAVASEQFDQAMEHLQDSDDPTVLLQSTAVASDLATTQFATGVDDALAGRPPAPFADGTDVALIADTFTGSFEVFAPLFDLMTGRSDQLQATATTLAADANRTAVLTLGSILAVLALLLVVSILVAATFEGPLSRLIEGTSRVGSGDLDVEPLPTDGPAEIGRATAAFNDVAANLRLLEGKVDALANADLDDPRLDQPLPGELGVAMERSIQLLSNSIAERQVLQARLAYQATHDALTALPNRPGALEALDGAMARAQRNGTHLAVAFLDLDGFKEVNDTYGHQTGDEVLREVARRLDHEARAGDFCARLGGDEFVMIAEDIVTAESAYAIGHRIAAAIGEPIAHSPRPISVGASIGIAFRTETDETALELLARADAAAYVAKRTGTVVEVQDQASLEPRERPHRAPDPVIKGLTPGRGLTVEDDGTAGGSAGGGLTPDMR